MVMLRRLRRNATTSAGGILDVYIGRIRSSYSLTGSLQIAAHTQCGRRVYKLFGNHDLQRGRYSTQTIFTQTAPQTTYAKCLAKRPSKMHVANSLGKALLSAFLAISALSQVAGALQSAVQKSTSDERCHMLTSF